VLTAPPAVHIPEAETRVHIANLYDTAEPCNTGMLILACKECEENSHATGNQNGM